MIAGKDLRAGGTWLGVNEYGLAVGILNRRINGTTLPAGLGRSRGLLGMDLLKCTSPGAAADFFAAPEFRYNPFTLVFADEQFSYVAYNNSAIAVAPLGAGLPVF